MSSLWTPESTIGDTAETRASAVPYGPETRNADRLKWLRSYARCRAQPAAQQHLARPTGTGRYSRPILPGAGADLAVVGQSGVRGAARSATIVVTPGTLVAGRAAARNYLICREFASREEVTRKRRLCDGRRDYRPNSAADLAPTEAGCPMA